MMCRCSRSFHFSRPRPASFIWSVFQVAVHVLFFLKYLLYALERYETAHCFTSTCLHVTISTGVLMYVIIVVANGTFCLFFALILNFVIVHDVSYINRNAALLQPINISGIEEGESKDQIDRKTSIRRLLQGGVKFIAWNELKLNTMVGRGHAAEVYSGT